MGYKFYLMILLLFLWMFLRPGVADDQALGFERSLYERAEILMADQSNFDFSAAFFIRGNAPYGFFERETSLVNPDARLNEHAKGVRQETFSNILTMSLKSRGGLIEMGIFNGIIRDETLPIEMPINGWPVQVGPLDSFAWRWTLPVGEDLAVISSWIRLHHPEFENVDLITRDTLSYGLTWLPRGWFGNQFRISLFWDGMSDNQSSQLRHYAGLEAVTNIYSTALFSRAEAFQMDRYYEEDETSETLWLQSFTFGCARPVYESEDQALVMGVAATRNFFPKDYFLDHRRDPLELRLFLQTPGFGPWTLQ